MSNRIRFLLVLGCVAWTVRAEAPKRTLGQRLANVDALAGKLIENKTVSGLVVYVEHGGKPVYFKAFGKRDVERDLPMERDTIFRIYSMSKPITAAAAMIAVDQGKLKVDDPVVKYIPEFKSLAPVDGKLERPMLVKDLMCHTAGFTYGFGMGKVDQMYRKARVLHSETSLTNMAEKLGKIPLLFSPGTKWNYGVSTDVLGLVVERATKAPFAEFLRKHLFEPLGMKDTDFFVKEDSKSRFAANYGAGMRLVDSATRSRFLRPTPLHSGGGGLVSTTKDYARFARMMASMGKLGDVRVLSKESVASMTSNQLDKALLPLRFGFATMEGMGFGYGMSGRMEATGGESKKTVGEYGWAGMASTTYTRFPRADLTVLVMTQRTPIDMMIGYRVRQAVLAAALSDDTK